MSTRGLQTLLTTSVTDRRHRTALLSGAAAAYTGFDLSPLEVASLQAIQADTLEAFALEAHRLFYGEDLASTVPAPAVLPAALPDVDCA